MCLKVNLISFMLWVFFVIFLVYLGLIWFRYVEVSDKKFNKFLYI